MQELQELQVEAQMRREFWTLPAEGLANRSMLGAALFYGREQLEKWAQSGDGPPMIRIGRRVLYRKSDVLEWLARTGRKVTSTAELSAGAAR